MDAILLENLTVEEAALDSIRQKLDECRHLSEIYRRRVDALKEIAELWES